MIKIQQWNTKDHIVYRDKELGDVVEISVAYNDAKWSGKQGVYIHVTPVTIEKDHGVTIRQQKIALGGGDPDKMGFKVFVQPMHRRNQKALQGIADRLEGQMDGWAAMWREKGAQATGQAIQAYLNPALMAM